MPRTVLFIGGGVETVPAIRRAKEMGLRTVVTDRNPGAPGFQEADHGIVASTYDVKGTLAAVRAYHRAHPVNGVLCVATDVPLTVAIVARELGLPGIPVDSARLAMDKLAMKERFQEDGVPIPPFRPVESAEEIVRAAKEWGYPVVVKPVDSRGARGVLRLDGRVPEDWAFEYARSHSPTGRVMVEKFLDGPQVSTESLVLDDVTHTVGFSDRNYEYLERFAPHIIENGGDLPSTLPRPLQKAVCEVVARAARSMGIRRGVVKGDIVVHRGHPVVIELAARLSGGYFCTHEIPLNTGVDFVGHAIRLALGEPVSHRDLAPRYSRPVCQRYLFPDPGRVEAVENAEEVARRPGIALCEIRVGAGDVIPQVESHPARAGVVIAVGESREEAQARAARAVQDIVIRTHP